MSHGLTLGSGGNQSEVRASRAPLRKAREKREATRAGGAPSRGSLYDEVTARIIAELEEGRFPWVQPWEATAASPGLPRNATTGRAYSGVNVLILWGAVIAGAYPNQGWLTFRQALAAGGCVRKGEQGVTVCYADRFTPSLRHSNDASHRRNLGLASPEAEKLRSAEQGDDGGDQSSLRGSDDRQSRSIPFLKRFVVFNVAQCDGLPAQCNADAPPLPERELVPLAENLISASGADFRIGGPRAFYSPSEDFVQVPPQPAFKHQIDFYRTALHELGHWTGHNSRLARSFGARFGNSAYAREELCAELASAYLCAALGIVPTVRHADYLGSWLAVLREDSRAIFKAASQASKAADYLLAFAGASQVAEAA
jgi:antirestriction protein ArdC